MSGGGVGLPDQLAQGIEKLGGPAMDGVKVHYNSMLPVAKGILAHTDGNDIHLAPGAERHLPHEAWHVVQQKQGRVEATACKVMGVVAPVFAAGEAQRLAVRAANVAPKP
jgi:hypothetical protein